MKKIALLLSAMLLFAGCQPAQQTDAPLESSEPSSSQSPDASQESSVSGQGSVGKPSDSSSEESRPSEPAPMPEGLPATTPEALSLPDAVFTSANGYGVELLTPAQYYMYQELNRGGYRGYQAADYFRVQGKEGEKFALANENGKLITDFLFDDDGESWLFWRGNTGVALSKDGRWGAVDAKTGEELIPFEYDRVNAQAGDRFVRAKGEQNELVDRSNNLLLTYDRGDDLSVLDNNLILHQNGMLRFYDKNAKPIKNFACEEFYPSVLTNLVRVKCNGKWGATNSEGDFIVQPMYEYLDYFNEQLEAAVYTQDGKKGVIDMNGEILIKPVWDDIVLYNSSASVMKDGKWGAFTDLTDKEPEIPPMYDYIYAFGSDGCAAFERKGRFGILDKEGNEIISAKYESITANNENMLDKGYYVIDGDGPGYHGIVSGKGETVIPPSYIIDFCYDENEPYHMIMTPRGKWGYIDRAGQVVIDTRYDNAGHFLPGKNVAFVEQEGKIRLIDRQGNTVLQTVFSDLLSYNPDTMVGAFEYTDADGRVKSCLARVTFPA